MKHLTIVLLSAFLFAFSLNAAAQKRYSGKRHTTSHGGHYKGGKGSSHKGGKYTNSRTSNRYGKHK